MSLQIASIQKAVEEAYARIKQYIRRTPLEYSYILSNKTSGNVYFKHGW